MSMKQGPQQTHCLSKVCLTAAIAVAAAAADKMIYADVGALRLESDSGSDLLYNLQIWTSWR